MTTITPISIAPGTQTTRTALTLSSPADLSDRELLDTTSRVASDERRTTVELIALLAEIDERRLYLGVGCASMFMYCRQVLRLSEHGAYNRIEAARAARRFPVVLEMLRDGSVTQTTVRLLRPHLTAENHAEVLRAARLKSKHEVEAQVAALAPKPDMPPAVRRLPMPAGFVKLASPRAQLLDVLAAIAPVVADAEAVPLPDSAGQRSARRTPSIVKPIAPARYVIKVTVGAESHARLRRAQDLLQHKRPGADAAIVIEEALKVLVEQLERVRFAGVAQPREIAPVAAHSRGRHIPAAIRRAVWKRDGGRCAFEGTGGRCTETGRLEFHHLVPFSDDGETSIANLSLRCRAHNRFERDRWFEP